MQNSYYVYVHLRGDDGLPFYVGKGKGRRARDTERRNAYWRSTVKRHGIIVKILWDDLTEDEAFSTEIRAIEDLRKYSPETMTNLRDGGVGGCEKKSTKEKQAKIRAFVHKSGCFPSQYQKEENKLRAWLASYCSPASHSYDAKFHAEMRLFGYGEYRGTKARVAGRKEEIREFFRGRGRLPRCGVPEERLLFSRLATYCSPSANAYDSEFDREMRALGYGSRKTGPKPKTEEK